MAWRLEIAERRNAPSIAVLALIFGLSFLVPLLVAGNYFHFFSQESESQDEVDDFFPKSMTIGSPETFLRVDGAAVVDPPRDKDFLFTGWFKLRTHPKPGDRMILVSKINYQDALRNGFALGISRDRDSMRAVVYWRDTSGRGSWFDFPEMTFPARQWFMLALSFYGGRYLGLHMLLRQDDGRIETRLVGGYELLPDSYPGSSAELTIGALGASTFRGKVGPVGVFNVRNLSEALDDILKDFRKDPNSIPSRFDEANVILWIPEGTADLGKHRLAVKLEAPARAGGRQAQTRKQAQGKG